MKILNNKNDTQEMKAMMGFEPAHSGKRIFFLLATTLPTELSILTTNCF